MIQKTYTIQTTETTDIHIGMGISEKLDTVLAKNNYSSFLILCDQTTNKLYGSRILRALQKFGKTIETHVLDGEEESKNITNLLRILEHLLEKGFDRRSALIAIGGGVVGDIATTAAGLYQRGIDCIQIPTTLLAQVDAALGGKGAVNIRNYKNMVGVIKQPRFIFIDPLLLKSLSKDQIRNGMGEIVKYAIAMDPKLFTMLENGEKNIFALFPEIIKRCVDAKMTIIQKDPHEKSGERQILNFGHTLGQAIELYAHLPHGEAISIGMAFAIKVSQKLLAFSKQEAEKAVKLIITYNLPVTLSKTLITKDIIYGHMKKDKKAIDGIPTFVLLEKIGRVKVGCRVPKDIINQTLEEILI